LNNVIIGAGISGISAALEFESNGEQYILLEKSHVFGGHCSSYVFEGCIFDEGPHISFTKNTQIQKYLWREEDSYITEPLISNYWKGKWIPQPVITNLVFLPFAIRLKVISSFLVRPRFGTVKNYQEWSHKKFGRYYSRNFVGKYTRKYWTLEPNEMSVEWIEKRIYSPKFREVIYGSIFRTQKNWKKKQHYVQKFVYPNQNGFQEFVNRLMRLIKNKDSLFLNSTVTSIDYKSRQIWLSNGEKIDFKNLISTIPLPNLIEMLNLETDSPIFIASKKLRATSLTLVDLVYDVEPLITQHWSYIYDEEFLTTRVHFPFKLNPTNCPPGIFNVQVEIYADTQVVTENELIEQVVLELETLGICSKKPINSQIKRIEFANVIFDHQRLGANNEILPFLKKHGIYTAGRFGNWDYSWSDDSFLSGANSAAEILMGEGLI
jgi:protoporphyrinogen oxidase